MKKRSLIFYISRFSGHYYAAKAIENSLISLDRGIETRMMNAFAYTNPVLGKIIDKMYLGVIKNKPNLWGNIYDNPDVLKKIIKARKLFHRYNMPKIDRLMRSYAPDIVYCTQAYPCGIVADYKKKYGSNVRLVGVLTDHAPHSYWLFDEVDFYVVPSEETAEVFKQKGAAPEKIKVFGIPVDGSFRLKHDRESSRKKYVLSIDKPVILVMGGTQGLGVMEQTVDLLMNDKVHGYQLLVVTGKNKGLYRRLQRKTKYFHRGALNIFSYTENIGELMDIADVVITKAGGMTTAEALTKELPLIITSPIPGQERMNASYLLREGAAVEVVDVEDTLNVVNRLFDSEGLLKKMKENAGRLAMPDSASKIAALALEGV